MQQSRLVQRQIEHLSDADREFGKFSESGEIPIVLTPKPPTVCQLSTTIPSGPFVLWQQWERDMGELSPGVIWFWPAWNRVSHIVTRAPIVYHIPVKDCPTADNGEKITKEMQFWKSIFFVLFWCISFKILPPFTRFQRYIGFTMKVMVNVEMSITFRIGPNADGARNFVYQIGANHFNHLLSAESEEVIQRLVYSTTHDKISDMKSEFALKMISTLNTKCNSYGVKITNVTIANITLPEELQLQLERITDIKTKIRDSAKIHESKLKTLEDEAEKELETIRKSNARKVQEISAQRKRYVIERRLIEEKAKGESRVKEVEAMTKAEVALKKAQGEEIVTKMIARKEAEAILKKTQIECQSIRVEAEHKAIITVKESEAQLKVAEAQAKALIAKAKAEGECADDMEEKRRYELEWARLKVLEKLAGKGRRFISGDLGEQILNQLVPLFTTEDHS